MAGLPDIMGDGSDQDAKRATGTDGRCVVPANRQQSSRETVQDAAGIYGPDKDSQNGDGQPNVLTFNALCETRRDIAGRGGSEVAGTRTQGLRIKSPLLYRLSYNLKR